MELSLDQKRLIFFCTCALEVLQTELEKSGQSEGMEEDQTSFAKFHCLVQHLSDYQPDEKDEEIFKHFTSLSEELLSLPKVRMCNQAGCGNVASHSFLWPGSDESFICELHLPKLIETGKALGMNVPVFSLEEFK